MKLINKFHFFAEHLQVREWQAHRGAGQDRREGQGQPLRGFPTHTKPKNYPQNSALRGHRRQAGHRVRVGGRQGGAQVREAAGMRRLKKTNKG